METRFFAVCEPDEELLFELFVCEKNTPIPTAGEIIERFGQEWFTADYEVVEITSHEFLTMHTTQLIDICGSAIDMMEYSPNVNILKLWRWWDSAEGWAEICGE